VEPSKLKDHWMRTVFVDDHNKVVEIQKQGYGGNVKLR
jgi:hypothetical protein